LIFFGYNFQRTQDFFQCLCFGARKTSKATLASSFAIPEAVGFFLWGWGSLSSDEGHMIINNTLTEKYQEKRLQYHRQNVDMN
jgi:hypothetical protein